MGQDKSTKTVFKGDIQRAIMLAEFKNKDETGHRAHASVRILKKVAHLDWVNYGLTEEMTISCSRGRTLTIHGRDLQTMVLRGDEWIVDSVKQALIPERAKEAWNRRDQLFRAIQSRKKPLRAAFSKNQISIITRYINNHYGYGLGHWGKTACVVLAALGPDLVFNKDIVEHLVEFRYARGVFQDMNRKDFDPVYHFPSHHSRDAARDTSTLGPVMQQIEDELEKQDKTASIPMVTYIIEIMIAAYEMWSGENVVDAAPTESAEPGKKQESTTSGKSKQASGSGKSQGKQSGGKPAKKSRPRRSKQTPDDEELKDLEFSMKSAPSQKAKSA